MERISSSELSSELKEKIYKTYKYKMHNTAMTYGLAILLGDPVIVYMLLKYIFTENIKTIPLAYIVVICFIAVMIICLHIFYLKNVIILSSRLKSAKYTYGVGKLTLKEDIGGHESENIGYSKYAFKIDNERKCKVLLAEDYVNTNIGDACTVLFIGNKAEFAFNNDISNMDKYISNYEANIGKKKKHKENRKIHIKDIFNTKNGVKGVFKGIVNAYDKVLENGDNINDDEEDGENTDE